MGIRRDVFRVERRETKIAQWWAKIPVAAVRGGVWVALNFADSQAEALAHSIRETKLCKRRDRWYLLITVEKEVELPQQDAQVVLAVDLGERFIAASVEFADGVRSAKLYGREVRGIRRHYAWLRTRLQKKGARRTVKRIGNKEKRKVRDICHKISRQIVNRAIQIQAQGYAVKIAVGDVRGHRKGNKGRTFNRIRSSMPSFQMKQMIIYKALWAGVPVELVPEAYTSKTCHRCGQEGQRQSQGCFVCKHCALQYNADLNGAANIAKRSLGYTLCDGAALTQPVNSCAVSH
jgi:putative transposase